MYNDSNEFVLLNSIARVPKWGGGSTVLMNMKSAIQRAMAMNINVKMAMRKSQNDWEFAKCSHPHIRGVVQVCLCAHKHTCTKPQYYA